MVKLNVLYYRMEPVIETDGEFITTQAFLNCSRCNDTIDTIGGPLANAICLKCHKEITQPLVPNQELLNEIHTFQQFITDYDLWSDYGDWTDWKDIKDGTAQV